MAEMEAVGAEVAAAATAAAECGAATMA